MRSADWTHNICRECWIKHYPQDELSYEKPIDTLAVICCWCGIPTQSGVTVREDPAVMRNCQHNIAVIIPPQGQ